LIQSCIDRQSSVIKETRVFGGKRDERWVSWLAYGDSHKA
jgi:hypothetical protein